MKLLLIATLAAVCVGCATAPPQRPTAAAHVYDLPAVTSAAPARVQIVRDAGFGGWVNLSLNGRKIASLGEGEFVEFALDPGEHQLSTIAANLAVLRTPTVLGITLVPNQQAAYRVGFDGWTPNTVFYPGLSVAR